MKKTIPAILIPCFIAVASVAPAAEDQKLKDEAELSYVQTNGNSEVATLSAKNLLQYQITEKDKASWQVTALNSKSDGVRSAESYSTEARLDHSISERAYAGVIVGWLKDKFAGVDQRLYAGPVAGYKFLLGPSHFLISEAGLDYVTEEYVDNTDRDYMRGRLFAQYDFQITEKTKFTQSLEYLHDFDESENYNVNSVTSFITSLSDSFSFKTSYEMKYDNQPVPATIKETDTIFTVALVFDY